MVITAERIDPRVRRTREQLQTAFLTLMSEQAFQDITVQDIAERAGVNRGTFYAHYTSKFTLMDSILRERVRAVLEAAIPADAPVTRTNLHALTRTAIEFIGGVRETQCRPNDHAYVSPLLEMAVQQEMEAFISDWLLRLPRAGSPPEMSLPMAATVVSWSIFGAALRWSRGVRDQSADAVAWQVVAALLKGVPTALGHTARLP